MILRFIKDSVSRRVPIPWGALRGEVREIVEKVLDEELTATLGTGRTSGSRNLAKSVTVE